MQYRLRTLLILLALAPPLLAFGWQHHSAWKKEKARRKAIAAEQAVLRELSDLIQTIVPAPAP